MDIIAGSTIDLRWDSDTRTFRPFMQVADGPVFRIQTLDFWQVQELLDTTIPALTRIRRGLEIGLVWIDGDTDRARQFLEHPKAAMVNPLFDEILGLAAGN